MFTPPALTLSSSSNAKALTEKDVAEVLTIFLIAVLIVDL